MINNCKCLYYSSTVLSKHFVTLLSKHINIHFCSLTKAIPHFPLFYIYILQFTIDFSNNNIVYTDADSTHADEYINGGILLVLIPQQHIIK